MTIVTVGLDIAKHAFQAHGVDRAGKVVHNGQNLALCSLNIDFKNIHGVKANLAHQSW